MFTPCASASLRILTMLVESSALITQVDFAALIACTTGVYCDCVANALMPNSLSRLTPVFSTAAKIGVLEAIVDGRSDARTNTPCRSLKTCALNHAISAVVCAKSRVPLPE